MRAGLEVERESGRAKRCKVYHVEAGSEACSRFSFISPACTHAGYHEPLTILHLRSCRTRARVEDILFGNAIASLWDAARKMQWSAHEGHEAMRLCVGRKLRAGMPLCASGPPVRTEKNGVTGGQGPLSQPLTSHDSETEVAACYNAARMVVIRTRNYSSRRAIQFIDLPNLLFQSLSFSLSKSKQRRTLIICSF